MIAVRYASLVDLERVGTNTYVTYPTLSVRYAIELWISGIRLNICSIFAICRLNKGFQGFSHINYMRRKCLNQFHINILYRKKRINLHGVINWLLWIGSSKFNLLGFNWFHSINECITKLKFLKIFLVKLFTQLLFNWQYLHLLKEYLATHIHNVIFIGVTKFHS